MARVTMYQISRALPCADELRRRYDSGNALGSAFMDTRGKKLRIPVYGVRDDLPNDLYRMEDGCFDITDIISQEISGAYDKEQTSAAIYQRFKYPWI